MVVRRLYRLTGIEFIAHKDGRFVCGSQGTIPGAKAGSLLPLPFPPTLETALYP
jgi:hypothetical protein